MDINACFALACYIANKEQTGNITPAQFNLLAPTMQISFINDRLGNVKKYKPHDPVPPYGWGLDDKTREELRPLYTLADITMTSGTGPLPDDYLYYDVFNVHSGGPPNPIVKILARDEFFIQRYSVIKPPLAAFPIGMINGANLDVLPTSITTVRCAHIRKPVTPVWGYTIVNDEPVYNAGTSQDFETSETTHFEIVSKILSAIGINLDVQMVEQYAQMEEAKGS